MPEIIEHDGEVIMENVATEEELLAFANKIREAGGADIIPALFPSRKGDSTSCLIATALNFSCRVDSDGYEEWFMECNSVIAQKIEEAMDLEVRYEGNTAYVMLPEHIGNAAEAFDEGLAFGKYAVNTPNPIEH